MHSLLLVISMLVTTLAANASEPLTMYGVVFLQPDQEMRQRIQNVEVLVAYVKSVESAATSVIANAGAKPASGGFIVLAVRPGQRSNVWLDFKPALPPELASSIVAKVRAVPPPSVANGPVALALKVGLWGTPAPSWSIPAPEEWLAAARKAGRAIDVSNLVELIWHD